MKKIIIMLMISASFAAYAKQNLKPVLPKKSIKEEKSISLFDEVRDEPKATLTYEPVKKEEVKTVPAEVKPTLPVVQETVKPETKEVKPVDNFVPPKKEEIKYESYSKKYDFRKATWGMSKDDVKNSESKKSPKDRSTLLNDGDSILEFGAESINNIRFDITYYFNDSGKLYTANYSKGYDLTSASALSVIYEESSLVDVLKEKYGEFKKTDFGKFRVYSFNSKGDTDVSVVVTTDDKVTLSLIYTSKSLQKEKMKKSRKEDEDKY